MKIIVFKNVGDLKPSTKIKHFGKVYYVSRHIESFTLIFNKRFSAIIPSKTLVRVLSNIKQNSIL